MPGPLSRQNSLKKRRQITELFQKGLWKKGRYFTLLYLEAPKTLCLYSASRSTPNAVQRNRKKRYAREIVKTHFHRLKPGHYAFIVKHLPETETLEILERDLLSLIDSLSGQSGAGSVKNPSSFLPGAGEGMDRQ